MSENKRCNDCRLATGRSRDPKKADHKLAIKCTVTGTWVSPFASICHCFEQRGRVEIGNGLLKLLKEKKRGSERTEK